MEERGQFTFYRSFYRAIMLQPVNRQRALFVALCEYALDGKEPELPNACMSAFVLMQPVLDTARSRAQSGNTGASVTNNKRSAKSDVPKQVAAANSEVPKQVVAAKSEVSYGKKEIEKKIEIDTECESKYEGTAVQPVPGGGTHTGEKTDFDVFFTEYPNAVSKEAAKEAWDEVVTDAGAVLESLRRWKRSPQWHREGGRFVPRAEKWLRERWFEASPREMASVGALGELGDAEMAAIHRIMGEE